MKDELELSADKAEGILASLIEHFADDIARGLIDCFYADALARNADHGNDGARVSIVFEVPGSDVCRSILDSRHDAAIHRRDDGIIRMDRLSLA